MTSSFDVLIKEFVIHDFPLKTYVIFSFASSKKEYVNPSGKTTVFALVKSDGTLYSSKKLLYFKSLLESVSTPSAEVFLSNAVSYEGVASSPSLSFFPELLLPLLPLDVSFLFVVFLEVVCFFFFCRSFLRDHSDLNPFYLCIFRLCFYVDILPRINPWDSLDYNNITSPIGMDIV